TSDTAPQTPADGAQAEIILKPDQSPQEGITQEIPAEESLPLVTADDISLEDIDKSFSDLDAHQLLGIQTAGPRNPFAPGIVEDQSDPTSLVIQGIVVNSQKGYVLVSDQIFTAGDRIGSYTIGEIRPGKVVLTQLEDKFIVRMEGYSQNLSKRQTDKYYVRFQGASLKRAMDLLATAGNLNIILPEETDGKVSVSFYNTDIMDALASILRVNELEYAFENEILRIGPAKQFADDSDLKAMTVPLNFATAKELETSIKTLLSKRGNVVSDERTNTVIIKDHANVLDSVRKFVTSIDTQDPQVSIEAKVISASKNFSRALGIQWGFSTGPNNAIFRGNQDIAAITGANTSGTIANFPSTTPATSGFNFLIGRLPGNSNLDMQLGAAESNGQIRIISKPNVTTINNKTANIRSGLKLYVKVEGGADEGPTLEEIDTGIELKVTPQITLNRMIKMEIEAIQSEADFSRTVDGIPAILDNTANTTVLVPDGETAVIGGLLKVNTNTESRGIPGISKVPVLGWLFKNTSKAKANSELMIFITPKILDAKHFKITDSADGSSSQAMPAPEISSTELNQQILTDPTLKIKDDHKVNTITQ
ncbi:MAG: hypothetical protein ACD_62C00492G0003, partial [uncultured bacterium]